MQKLYLQAEISLSLLSKTLRHLTRESQQEMTTNHLSAVSMFVFWSGFSDKNSSSVLLPEVSLNTP